VLVKANVSIVGSRDSVTGSITLLDEAIANLIEVKYVGRRLGLAVAYGHEVSAELAIVHKLIVEGEELPGAHIAVFRFSDEIKKRLKAHGVMDGCIIGLSALEILGLAANTTTGKVERVGSLLVRIQMGS
jgi:hypothetical protein